MRVLVSVVPRVRTRDKIGHFQVIGAATLAKSLCNAKPVLRFAILIHLPLALEPRDDEAETDNAAHHRIDEGVGRVGGRPRF